MNASRVTLRVPQHPGSSGSPTPRGKLARRDAHLVAGRGAHGERAEVGPAPFIMFHVKSVLSPQPALKLQVLEQGIDQVARTPLLQAHNLVAPESS